MDESRQLLALPWNHRKGVGAQGRYHVLPIQRELLIPRRSWEEAPRWFRQELAECEDIFNDFWF
jgi:hypothetical protein